MRPPSQAVSVSKVTLLAITMIVIGLCLPGAAGGKAEAQTSGSPAVKSPASDAGGVANDGFQGWVDAFWSDARKAGITRSTFQAAFNGIEPNPEVLKSASNQPEFVRPVWDYLDSAISEDRVETGNQKLSEMSDLLSRIEKRHGVDRQALVAIWGMESAYGTFMGDRNVIQALATLGYRGKRQKFGRSQLIAALKILQRGDVTPERMLGSWAGAMGHTQFIPTTYNAYAVDHDGDGRRDIWTSEADALASTANYLKKSGWKANEPWGHEILLPKGFDYRIAKRSVKKLTAEWVGLGVRRANGLMFDNWSREAAIVLPAGARGPAFLVYANFNAIMRYNNSIAYALAVAGLADRFRGTGQLIQPWPLEDAPLTRSQKKELQQLLSAQKLYKGEVDGRIGTGTQAAIRTYQNRIGVAQDGYASASLLERLRRDS